MARRIVAAVALLTVLSGCAHVHRIDLVRSESDLQDLNRAVRHRRVSVQVAHRVPHRLPMTLRAESVRAAADSTSLTLLLEPGDVQFVIAGAVAPFSVDVSTDGVGWNQVHETSVPGVHAVHLDYPDPPEGWLYVRFGSEGAALASFTITMSCTTPVEESTWGLVKALFR
jgi:hypothetical protein